MDGFFNVDDDGGRGNVVFAERAGFSNVLSCFCRPSDHVVLALASRVSTLKPTFPAQTGQQSPLCRYNLKADCTLQNASYVFFEILEVGMGVGRTNCFSLKISHINTYER